MSQQYDQKVTEVITNISNSGLSQSTKDAITSIVSVAGTTDVKVEKYDPNVAVSADTQVLQVSSGVKLTSNPGTAVIIMDKDAGGSDVTLDSAVTKTVVGSANSDKITFTGDAAVTVETGGGQDQIATGSGDDTINVKGINDNSTVNTGDGNDKVVVEGEGKVVVQSGKGNSTIVLGSDKAEVTVDGGEGFDKVQLDDARSSHKFSINENGELVMNSSPTTISNIQVVEFAGNNSMTAIAQTAEEGLMARLYQVTFGRQAMDATENKFEGMNFWFDFSKTSESLQHTVNSFINSDEFNSLYAEKSDGDYVAALLQNMRGTEASAEEVAKYTGELEAGTSRANVAWEIAASDEAVKLMGIDGSQYVISLDLPNS